MDTSAAIVSQLRDLQAFLRRSSATGGLTSQGLTQLDQGLDATLATARYAATAQTSLQHAPTSRRMRPLPTGGLRVKNVVAVANGTTSDLYPVLWPIAGICIGIRVGTIENTSASLGALSVRVTYNNTAGNTSDIWTDGQAGAFAHFASTFYSSANEAQAWACAIPFDAQQQWQVYFKNEASSGTYTPVCEFDYIAL